MLTCDVRRIRSRTADFAIKERSLLLRMRGATL